MSNDNFPVMPVVEEPNWHADFKEWVRSRFPVLSTQEETRLFAAWRKSRNLYVFTEQQRYAISQLYGAVKFGGYPYHDNSRIAEALVVVADMLRTPGA